jgi:hypothetical protein
MPVHNAPSGGVGTEGGGSPHQLPEPVIPRSASAEVASAGTAGPAAHRDLLGEFALAVVLPPIYGFPDHNRDQVLAG